MDETRIGSRHPGAVLTVDLHAIRANYRFLRGKVGRNVQCAAVMKADAYGLGADCVGVALYIEGCRHFFVAHFDEGLRLQPLVADAEIYVLNGLPRGCERDCAHAGLTPVLNSLEQFEAWSQCAKVLGKMLPAVIQIDSGMNRFGWSRSEIARWIEAGAGTDHIDVRFVMSHLACADTPLHPANETQLNRFRDLTRYFPGWPRSFANSSGIFLGREYHFDLVRPGAALYGLNPVPGQPNPMRPVVRLTTNVIQLRDADKGHCVGYGADCQIGSPARLATLSIGYADGLHRALHASGRVYFDDQPLPIAGRISMDCMSVDVTAVPSMSPGAEIDVIGCHQSVDDLAEATGTIGYEVLVHLGHRFERRYRGGGDPVNAEWVEELQL